MLLYKLTNRNDQTRGGCQWGEGITHKATPGRGKLCSEYYIHAYTHPLLAILLNPIYVNFDLETAHLWEGKGRIAKKDYGLKVGCKTFTTTKRLDLPVIAPEQQVKFAILCAREVYKNMVWNKWADNWLFGKNRSAGAAAWAAAEAAGAAGAAWAAAEAAGAAAGAAGAAGAAWAAAEAAEAAWAAAQAAGAAWAAAWAAAEAAWTAGAELDLIAIAKKAVEE